MSACRWTGWRFSSAPALRSSERIRFASRSTSSSSTSGFLSKPPSLRAPCAPPISIGSIRQSQGFARPTFRVGSILSPAGRRFSAEIEALAALGEHDPREAGEELLAGARVAPGAVAPGEVEAAGARRHPDLAVGGLAVDD